MRHLPARDHLLRHAPVQPVDPDDPHHHSGRDHREVDGRRRRAAAPARPRPRPRSRTRWRRRRSSGSRCRRERLACGQAPAEAASGEHGHRGQRAEASQGSAEGDAHQQRCRLHRGGHLRGVRVPPQREVGEAERGQGQPDVAAQGRAGEPREPAAEPRRGEPGQKRGRGDDGPEDHGEVQGQDQQVARLACAAADRCPRRRGSRRAPNSTPPSSPTRAAAWSDARSGVDDRAPASTNRSTPWSR